jgi:hypothetical protein
MPGRLLRILAVKQSRSIGEICRSLLGTVLIQPQLADHGLGAARGARIRRLRSQQESTFRL